MSIAYGVKIIEKHFTLSRKDGGPDSDFSMEPHELKIYVKMRQLHSKRLVLNPLKGKEAEISNIKFRRSIYIIDV